MYTNHIHVYRYRFYVQIYLHSPYTLIYTLIHTATLIYTVIKSTQVKKENLISVLSKKKLPLLLTL